MDKIDLGPKSGQSGKVINLSRFTSGQSLSPIRQAEAYWTALRQGGSIPRRSDVDPRGLENLLHCAFVLEGVAPGIARFRIAGRHIAEITGMEVRGMPITALFTPLSRKTMSDALTDVFSSPAIAELTLSAEPLAGQGSFEAHMVLLPLKDDNDKITRALGVVVSEDVEQRQAARFNITGISSRRVGGLTYSAARKVPADGAESKGFADAPQPFERGVRHLRLVKTDE